ncbi:MAG: FAD-binding protein [Deltaproteobacteria bacterium]|nr:FAD-binding protein [Deltaproteobacteria bacterium]
MSKDLVAALRRVMQGDVRFDRMTRQLYSTDASMYQIEPMGVVFPRDAEDLAAAVETALAHKAPVLPRGGGTSLAGQCVGEAVMMDLSTHMNKVLELNTEEGWARVQPGVVQDSFNAFLAPHGFLFGPDTSTSNRATLGGMTGNNSCGSRSVIYGKTIDHVLEARVILADGSRVTFGELDDSALEAKLRLNNREGHIYRELLRIGEANREEVNLRFPKIMRRVAGYNLDELLKPGRKNLAKMMVGSEGTLAVWSELKVKIVRQPKVKAVLVAQFEDMIQAVEADNLILAHKPSAMELVDDTIIREAVASPAFTGKTGFLRPRSSAAIPGAVIIVEFYGESRAELESKLEKLEADLKRNKMGYAHVRALSSEEQSQVWNLRKGGLGLLMGRRADAKPLPFVEDTAVDPSRLAEYLKEFDKIVKKHDTSAGYYGHASVGCLHIRPFIDLKKSGEKEKLMSIFTEVADLVQQFGGTMTGEHGDGLARSWLIERLFGPKITQALREVKAAFDPENRMNPGKIVDAQHPMENLRWGKEISQPIVPSLDFTRDGGYAFALEMCNGNGNCRKLDLGTMCPSYQVTREDRHSTRGRANALKGVLQGDLQGEAYLSRDMYEVMELCLECKGCKTECPSKVDMAKFKYEFLYQYQKKHGVSLRNRLFANIAAVSPLGSALAPLSNWVMNSMPHRGLLNLLGVSSKRTLPAFSRQRFSRWFAARTPGESGRDPRPAVVLFADTFVEHNTPALGRDTVEILERAGYRVIVPERRCCGRPMISKGLLDQARENAAFNLAVLKPYAQQGLPIVGVEPSCILTLKEEYRDLLPGADADLVARQTRTIDEFLAELTLAGKLPYPQTGGAPREFLLHGHCHQKALVGTSATVAVLKGIPGAAVKEINSGCCGMAGTFGYEKEHYAMSLAIGEQRLFPAVRAAAPGAVVVADGMSCRHQIAHGTGREALHLVEVVAKALRA